ncbi:hypothetical protein Taro_009789 [Colocasia esculenta]|uniref:Uncharacterized protein n=1 Tax=Colocasia esculenta TaxID=4460 RepID=A0A843U7I1_COLES|nr:hypothetical protein [Colocasia esculenta]
MVKKAQLLEDATDFTDRIKGKFVKKEMTYDSSSDTNCNNPRTRPSAYAEDPIFTVVAHGSGDPEGL